MKRAEKKNNWTGHTHESWFIDLLRRKTCSVCISSGDRRVSQWCQRATNWTRNCHTYYIISVKHTRLLLNYLVFFLALPTLNGKEFSFICRRRCSCWFCTRQAIRCTAFAHIRCTQIQVMNCAEQSAAYGRAVLGKIADETLAHIQADRCAIRIHLSSCCRYRRQFTTRRMQWNASLWSYTQTCAYIPLVRFSAPHLLFVRSSDLL